MNGALDHTTCCLGDIDTHLFADWCELVTLQRFAGLVGPNVRGETFTVFQRWDGFFDLLEHSIEERPTVRGTTADGRV